MRELKKIILITLSFIAAVFVISVFLPKTGKVERSLTFTGNIDSVFDKINTLERWPEWTVWFEMDKDAKINYEGPKSGSTAMMQWDGKDGKGKIIIIESKRPTTVGYAMRFFGYAPFYGNFKIRQNADATITVFWSVSLDAGKNPFKKYFCLLMDTFMGEDMEKSLGKL